MADTCEDFSLSMPDGPKREDYNVYYQTNWAAGPVVWLWDIYSNGRRLGGGSEKRMEDAITACGKALLAEVRR